MPNKVSCKNKYEKNREKDIREKLFYDVSDSIPLMEHYILNRGEAART